MLAGRSDAKTQQRLKRDFFPDSKQQINFARIRKLAKADHSRRMRVDPTLKVAKRGSGRGNGSGNGNSSNGNR